MTEGALIVIAIRLVVPLFILRYNLVGGLAAVAVDALDVVFVEIIGRGGFGDYYSQTDKALDTYYLALEFVVSLAWDNPWMRIPAIVLFVHRAIGVVAFEITGIRWLLLVFPNMFENWWLYCVIVAGFAPRVSPRSWATMLVPMTALLIPKLGQEYLLHYQEAQPWDWIKRNILGTS
jgi:hypothetical protein